MNIMHMIDETVSLFKQSFFPRLHVQIEADKVKCPHCSTCEVIDSDVDSSESWSLQPITLNGSGCELIGNWTCRHCGVTSKWLPFP